MKPSPISRVSRSRSAPLGTEPKKSWKSNLRMWTTSSIARRTLATHWEGSSAEMRSPTIYVWRKRFGTMSATDTKKLKALETENGRLKKMVADRDLELEVLKEITAKKW
jgi:putative transposase